MATDVSSFLDYINKNQSGKAPVASARPAFNPAPAPTSTSLTSNKPPQDTLSWLFDILSRPLFGVQNTINAGVDRTAQAAKDIQKGDIAGAIGQGVQDLGAKALGGDFLTGFFSQDPNQQKYTGQTMEHIADTSGSFDPNYKNVQDNVNPWVKGIGGFVGDVALDPLTYIPGAVLVKGFKGANTALKAAVHAGGAAGDAARVSEKAAARVAKEREVLTSMAEKQGTTVDKLLEADPTLAKYLKPEAIDIPLSEKLAVPKAPKVPKGETPVPKTIDEAAALLEQGTPKIPAAAIPKSLTEQLAAHPRNAPIGKMLDSLEKDVAASAKVTTKAPPLKPLIAKDWLKEHVRIGGATDTVVDGVRVISENKPFIARSLLKDQYWKTAGLGKSLDAEQVSNFLKSRGVPPSAKLELNNVLKSQYADYVDGFNAAAKNKMRMGVDFNELPNLPASVTKLSDTLAAFNARLAADMDAVEGVLGQQLTSYLKAKKSPARFVEAIDTLKKALVGASPVDEIMAKAAKDSEGAALRALFSSLGIDVKSTLAAREGVADLSQTEVLKSMMVGEVSEDAMKQAKAFQAAHHQELVNLPERYSFESGSGTLRDAEEIGSGLGRNARELNSFSMYTFGRHLWGAAKEELGKLTKRPDGTWKLGGEPYAEAAKSVIMPWARARDSVLAANRIPMYIGTGNEKRMMYWSQLVDILSETGEAGRLAMRPVLWNGDTLIPETNLAEAARMVVAGADDEAVRAMLLNDLKHGEKGLLNQPMPNPMSSGGVFGFRTRLPKKYAVEEKRRKLFSPEDTPGISWRPKGKSGWEKVYSSEKLTNDVLDTLKAAKNDLAETMVANEKAFGDQIIKDTYDLTDEALRRFEDLMTDPAKIAQALQEFADSPAVVRDLANLSKATGRGQVAASVLVESSVEGVRKAGAKGAVDTVKATTAAGRKSVKKSPADVVKETVDAGKTSAQKAATAVMDDTQKIASEATGIPIAEIDLASSGVTYGGVSANRWMKLDPLRKMFDSKWNVKDIYQTYHSSGNLNMVFNGQINRILNDLSKQFDRPSIAAAFRNIQNGTVTEGVAGAVPGLRSALDHIFLTTDDGLLGNSFFRNNESIYSLNEAMAHAGMEQVIDVDAALKLAKINKTSINEEAAKQWREWSIEDPADFISRMATASSQLVTDQAVGQSFVRLAEAKGWTSKVMKPGYVKITSTGESKYLNHIDTELFYDRQIADQLHMLDQVSRQSRSLDGEMGKFIHKYLDPIQNAWKYAITLPRPGHHIRNFNGDQSMTFVAEGTENLMSSVKKTFKVLAVRNDYEGVDVVRTLNHFGDFKTPGKGDIILKSSKFGDWTADDIFKDASEAGIMPTYRVNEDFLLEDVAQSSFIQKTADALTLRHGKIEKLAGGVSEYRDHYSRLQHFIQFIEKAEKTGTYKTRAEVMLAAAAQVKKFHPDANMLSTFEAKYMRRIIPFYTWLRGVMPAVAETLGTQPGRILVFPKASFNIATAMGVNPDSLADPFPSDQMFPSFLTDQVAGPVFGSAASGYWGLNPGVAHMDVLNMLGADPVRGILGATSPIGRVPFEMMAGGSLGTGAQIKDNSDYLDSTLPGVNYISNVTGQSVTGSLFNMLSGSGRGLDPQYQVGAGNKGPIDQASSAFNWLTGLGLNNQSRPNYINYAEIEKRNRAANGGRSGF